MAVLRQVAEGVLIHQSEFCQSNAVVVQGRAGVLQSVPAFSLRRAAVTAVASRLALETVACRIDDRKCAPNGHRVAA